MQLRARRQLQGSSAGVNPDSFRTVAQAQTNLESRFLRFRHPDVRSTPSQTSKENFPITQCQSTTPTPIYSYRVTAFSKTWQILDDRDFIWHARLPSQYFAVPSGHYYHTVWTRSKETTQPISTTHSNYTTSASIDWLHIVRKHIVSDTFELPTTFPWPSSVSGSVNLATNLVPSVSLSFSSTQLMVFDNSVFHMTLID